MLPPVWEDEAHHFETCYLGTPAYEVCVARNVWSLHMSLEHTGVWCLVWTKSVRNYTGCPLDCRIFNAMKCWSDTNCCKHEKIVMAKSGPPMSFIYSCSFFFSCLWSRIFVRDFQILPNPCLSSKPELLTEQQVIEFWLQEMEYSAVSDLSPTMIAEQTFDSILQQVKLQPQLPATIVSIFSKHFTEEVSY